MAFPQGYAEAEVYTGEYERLEPGGHYCRIRNMKITESQNGNKMIVIEFDTDLNDRQAQFYQRRYDRDKEAGRDATWRGIHRVIVDERLLDKNGRAYGISNLKQLVTTVEDSNEGLTISDQHYDVNNAWFCQQFVDKKIGIVFREEDYADPVTGEARMAIKPAYLCNYSKAPEQDIPKRKDSSKPKVNENGFMQVREDLADEGLPFV